jgi:hypothetical protein
LGIFGAAEFEDTFTTYEKLAKLFSLCGNKMPTGCNR